MYRKQQLALIDALGPLLAADFDRDGLTDVADALIAAKRIAEKENLK